MRFRTRMAAWLAWAALSLPHGSAQALLLQPQWMVLGHDPGPVQLARGGGAGRGGGARAGGGARSGGGGGVHRGQTGFQGSSGGFSRGTARPSGGWSHRLGPGTAHPSLERPPGALMRPAVETRPAPATGLTRPAIGTTPGRPVTGAISGPAGRGPGSLRPGPAGGRDIHHPGDRPIQRDGRVDINRNWQRQINVHPVNLHPGWARPGWGVARPWPYGWYGGWTTPAWSWWGGRAALWGITALATAAMINAAVDSAISSDATAIAVPDSGFELLYGTVRPIGSGSISFDVMANGAVYSLTADCNAGTLNGQQPDTAAEAQLLNAACQVAFGST